MIYKILTLLWIEVFKPIVWYEGLYEISNMGRVKSLAKKRNWTYNHEEKILKLQFNWKYKQIHLCKNWSRDFLYVNRLVWKAFLPNQKETINHKDWDKINNKLTNLEWCTYSENLVHSYKMWRKNNVKPVMWEKDWKRYFFKSIIHAWKEVWTHPQNIWKCCSWKRKTAWGYSWMYCNTD